MGKKKNGHSLGRPKISEGKISTKELILKTAAQLFLENGYQKVSIDDIATDAGLTKASVYYYFASKAELFKEVMITLMEQIQDNIAQLLGSDKPLHDRLFDVLIAHLKATLTIDLEGFIRESKTSLSVEQVKEIKMAEENIFLRIEQAFTDAMEKGEIPQINSKFAAHSYIALTRVGNYKNSNGLTIFPNIEEAAANIMSVFWKGFFKEL